MSTLWLLYPVSAASFENCKSVRSELLQAIWRDLGTFEIRHSSHVGAGMRLLFPLKEPGPDDAFDLYKALEEDELADGLVFRKFPFQRATRIATAHSGATVALCDDQIYFMYGSDYDEFSCLRIKFSRTGNFHIAKADEVKAVHDFIDLVGQRQLEWLKDGHAP
ncbi:MAG: hypothetical protein JNM43_00405 [Planctomycetaceae bacterium]|nr:hypothetical protein [Planctomycetaceae bacterium]